MPTLAAAPNVYTPGTPAADALAAVGRHVHARGWVFGTSGNVSVVTWRDPLRLAITASDVDTGALQPALKLDVDEDGSVRGGAGRPLAETLLHVTPVKRRGAGAVLHRHSVSATVLSGTDAEAGGLGIEGCEMLEGLDGVRTHHHREWVHRA